MNKKVAVFAGNGCKKEKEEQYFALAHELGTLLAKNNFVTVTGAGAGLMDETMRGTSEAGGETIGVALNFVGRKSSQYAASTVVFDTLGPRQDKLITLADAYIALPGGVGTLYEVFNILALKRLKEIPRERPLILIGGYYDMVTEMIRNMAAEGFVEEKVFEYFTIAANAQEAIEMLKGKMESM